MLSVLGKLLCRELGEQKYNMYFRYYSLFADRCDGKHTELIFRDIYGQLADKDMYTLHKMLERLLETVTLSIKISKQYMWVWLCTIITIIILILAPVSLLWTVCGIILAVTGFGYKSVVFIVNRYCVVDADIILLYKTALYHKIMTNIL
ncbi:MAG: hypothetical protein E7267_08480 [Lachnospiraceae bacterium]|nr:hypothetical protein [Lachnospiraceae bacterium]